MSQNQSFKDLCTFPGKVAHFVFEKVDDTFPKLFPTLAARTRMSHEMQKRDFELDHYNLFQQNGIEVPDYIKSNDEIVKEAMAIRDQQVLQKMQYLEAQKIAREERTIQLLQQAEEDRIRMAAVELERSKMTFHDRYMQMVSY